MNNSDTEVEPTVIVKRPVGRPRKEKLPKILKPSGRPKSNKDNNKYDKKKFIWEVTTKDNQVIAFNKVKDIAVHFNSSVTSVNRVIYEDGVIKHSKIVSVKKKDIV